MVEGEAPSQPPVAGAGGSELPRALAALQELQLGHRVGGDPPEALRVQHRSGDADEEDDDLRGAKPTVSTSQVWRVKFHPRPRLAAIWVIAGSF